MITIDHAKLPPGPSPIDQIHAIEAQPEVQNALTRLTRQNAIATKLREANAQGLSHDDLLKTDSTYRRLVEVEALIVPLREQMRAEDKGD